jgi:chemotaxis protein methyltransferase CheR
MENIISEKDFKQIKDYIYSHSGIDLAPTKRAMVSSRLSKRLRHYKLEKFADYLKIALAADNSKERQVLMDLLTTNETYFFREMGHFDYLKQQFLPQVKTSQSVRIWSGASSTGEEAYSLSMLLADKLGKNGNWEIFGSDICTEVIKTARAGHYSTNRIDGIPPEYLKKYCLKGTGPYEGTLLVDPELRKKVSFAQVNLNTTLPKVVGEFDVVFLRNILIYFNLETKQQIVKRVVSALKPGGLFFIGHSETLKEVSDQVVPVKPTVYKKI